MTNLREVVESLKDDIYCILEIRRPDPETAAFEIVEHTFPTVLFTAPTTLPPNPS